VKVPETTDVPDVEARDVPVPGNGTPGADAPVPGPGTPGAEVPGAEVPVSDVPVSDVPGDDPVRRRGRRPAGEDTRGLILAEARSEFGSRGYDGTTMRGIARSAGVDPRLVHHYFAGKEDIFVTALGFPARPQEIVGAVMTGPLDQLGERLARTIIGIWDSPDGRDRITALLSGAMSSDAAARMLREFVTRELLGRIAAALEMDRGELRAALAASHLVGVAMARVVVKIEPLASLDADELARIVGPVLQRYLTDPALLA
jgi:AcrR family transcriptional regulator